MKSKLLLFTFFISFISFSQNDTVPKIILQSKNIMVNDTVWLAFNNLKSNDTYILKINEDKSIVNNVTKNFVAKSEGLYKLYLQSLDSGNILDSLSFDVEKSYSFLKINSVTIKNYPSNKKTGAAWDNAFSNYKPDVYLKITNQTKNSVLKTTNKKSDLQTNTEFTWTFDNLIIANNLSDTYQFLFFDDDSVTEDDFIGGIKFISLIDSKSLFRKNKGSIDITNLDKYGCSFTINYQWY